jgi:hypothetical protein
MLTAGVDYASEANTATTDNFLDVNDGPRPDAETYARFGPGAPAASRSLTPTAQLDDNRASSSKGTGNEIEGDNQKAEPLKEASDAFRVLEHHIVEGGCVLPPKRSSHLSPEKVVHTGGNAAEQNAVPTLIAIMTAVICVVFCVFQYATTLPKPDAQTARTATGGTTSSSAETAKPIDAAQPKSLPTVNQ